MRQRIRQFATAGASPGDDDYALGREWLTEPLRALFEGQHPRDIVHSANTARWLLKRGHREPDLIVAALLHDVGKGHQRRLDRTAYVLACKARVVSWLGAAGSRIELRRAVARTLSHSQTGAETIARAGAPARVVDLTLRHHGPAGEDPMLALLQQADAAS
jgi:putative nucleotidyltransferase with HDIG domain